MDLTAPARRLPLRRLIQFGLAGLPAYAVAVPVNYALVKWLGVSKPAAYGLVLVMQVVINFFVCRRFVFKPDHAISLWKSFVIFLNGILIFRLLDWGLYWFLAVRLELPFIGVQLFNVLLFGLAKFEFSRRLFEGREPKPAAPAE
jgi:putative flippase GtrA